jgi:hypothetical protein
MRPTFAIAAFTLAATLSLNARADVVTDWNKTTVDEIRKLGLGPNPATRTLAIAHIAAYDAVNSITKTHDPYHALLSAPTTASPEAAAASAFYWALLLQYPAEKVALDTALAESLAVIPDGDGKTQGVALGKAAAVDIFTLRTGDGSAATATYPGSTDAGKWRPTPRADLSTPLPALEPWWRNVTPFALTSPSQFRPAPPPDITSVTFATAYLETKSLGKIDSTTRTTDQTAIANFWKQATHIPFNAIARSVSKVRQFTLDDNARLFALLNITLADTRISVWDAKYEYGYWRPITAINTTTDYGNAAAVPDATWVPLIETPNHPEYPSGHSITGGGAARVLATLFGGDAASFAVGSDTLPGVTRGFSAFSDAEQENANSRIYGGIHYRFSNETGIALGHQVADYVIANYLKPVVPVVPVTPIAEGGAAGESSGGAAGSEPAGGSSNVAAGAGGALASAGEGPVGVGAGGEPTSGTGSNAEAGDSGSGGSNAGAGASTSDNNDSGCSIGGTNRGFNLFASALLAGVACFGLRRRRARR